MTPMRRRPWTNPLVRREAGRMRQRAPWVAPAALVAALISCVLTIGPLAALSRDRTDAASVAAWSTVLGGAGACLLGPAWLLVQVVLAVLAGTGIQQLFGSGLGESLRLTLLRGPDVVDGYFVRALLRYPLWLVVAPLLPLTSTALTFAGVLEQVQRASGPALDPLTWAVAVAYPLFGALIAIAQLAACVEIGVLSGLETRTPGGHVLLTLVTLFVFELILPSTCAASMPLAQMILLGTANSTSPGDGATGRASVLAALSLGAGLALVQLVYHLAVFFGARALAANRFDGGER